MIQIIRKLNNIFKVRIEWHRPAKVKTIIYGDFNAGIILQYVNPKEAYVLKFDIINAYVAAKCILKFDFSTFGYICNFLRLVKPNVVITSIDNDVFFWSLKGYFPKIKTILLQYAMHTELGDIFGELKRNKPKQIYEIDHLFLFNVNVRDKYLEYINGNTHIIGSFKNNHITTDDYSTPCGNVVTFVSQYRPEQVFHPVFFYDGNTPYFRDSYYETETVLLPLLWRYCRDRNIRFQICGHGNTHGEYNFFGKLIGNYDWDFIPRLNSLDSYKTVFRSRVVIGVDSALAFESFGTGIRVGLFPGRHLSLKNDSFRIGWPNSFEPTGPFWTSHVDESEVKRILNFLLDENDFVWKETCKKYSKEIMSYDRGNTQFIKILRQLNVPLKPGIL